MFICSSVPAVVLALTVSPLVALIVAGLYVGYHLIENYYIGPKVFGGRLRLSHLAVILAFAVGAEVGGIVGAILALPVAAMYPVLEQVWLKDYLGRDAVETHRRMSTARRSAEAARRLQASIDNLCPPESVRWTFLAGPTGQSLPDGPHQPLAFRSV